MEEDKWSKKFIYKVLVEKDDKLYSTLALDNKNKEIEKYIIEYPLGAPTKASVGKLFVFKELENARMFAGENFVIYKCLHKGKVEKVKQEALNYNVGTWPIFWLRGAKNYNWQLTDCAGGSYLVTEMLLLEKVN